MTPLNSAELAVRKKLLDSRQPNHLVHFLRWYVQEIKRFHQK
jgi:hypothetical protein